MSGYFIVGGVVVSAAVIVAVMLRKTEPPTQSIPPPPSSPQNLAEPIGIFKSISDGVVSMISEPRGIRNKNPLNMRWYSVNNWVGQVGKDESGYIIFDKPENGIRAAGKTLDSYARRGVVTLGAIIASWAPAVENNVENYVKHVEQQTGFNRGRVISRASGDFAPLLAAMIKHENGKQPYSMDLIRAGLALP